MALRSLMASAVFNPAAILGQFLLAGLSLFHDADLWVAHGILSSALALPVSIVPAFGSKNHQVSLT